MARITVEDCLKKVDNRFTLIHMAAKRVRQLRKGAEPTIVSKNKDIVVSLREIVAGHVTKADRSAQDQLLGTETDLLPEAPDEDVEKNAVTDENKEEKASEDS
jgi:DNA-directed RNA polymerase subunit omega